MYCAPLCSLPLSDTLRLLSCEAVLEPQQRCRSHNRYWQSPERAWCLRNGRILQMLANLLGKPVEQVCIFMSGLTLKKFGEIMNPKCGGWNHCCVPLIRPYTCIIYNAIFDMEGNIRNPLHVFIIRILLSIMDHYLNIPCQQDTLNRRPKIDDMFTGHGVACFDLFSSGRRGKRGANGQKCGQGGNDEDIWDELNKFLDDIDDDVEDVVEASEESFDDHVSEEKPNKGHYNLHKKKVAKKVVIVEEVVEKPPKVKKPKKKRIKKVKGRDDRRYIGKQVPVLMHAPFDKSKPWTWVRRHPLQERVLQDNKIGRTQVHRYKRETLERQIKAVSHRYSVHSTYEVEDNQSLQETAMFGHGHIKKRHRGMAKAYDYKKLREAKHAAEDDNNPKS